MTAFDVTEISELDQILRKYPGKVILVDFAAKWCGPCKRIAPIIHDLNTKYDFVLVKVDVDEADDLSDKYKVRSMPTFMFFKDNQHITTLKGAGPQVVNAIQKMCPLRKS